MMNPSKTFDTFSVTAQNQDVYQAALAVVENPARRYNPLVIQGGKGVGKTHLLHAIGNAVRAKNGGLTAIYIDTEEFTSQFINATRNGDLSRFRNKYRSPDVLLLDDVHLLAANMAIQEEFFHTFNSLFDGHKQIVLASTHGVSELPNLEERIAARLDWGLVTEIRPPSIWR